MTDAVPAWLAQALPNVRPGHAALTVAKLGNEAMLGKSGFQLTSAAFENGGELDPCFTADEEDAVAPPLEWTTPPPGSLELALIVEDPDAQGGQPVCHWLVWGLTAQLGKLMEGEIPPRVGKNAKRNSEWLLPEPPHDDEPHDYVFQLFALDLPLTLMPGAKREELIKAMEGHIIGVAVLTGTYARVEADEDELEEDAD